MLKRIPLPKVNAMLACGLEPGLFNPSEMSAVVESLRPTARRAGVLDVPQVTHSTSKHESLSTDTAFSRSNLPVGG